VAERCDGDSRAYLESICMKLPEEKCVGADDMSSGPCGTDEFHCGDGQCVHGLDLCDYKYACKNGADELRW